ncbi:hypothetical protein DYBT9275_01582 [Dyadobacter sp. CECT 9275]|uniref:Uncharacterized protein n=1 Tax=Dyadobacter helix TaxID=2822344 RepID=A0A916JAK5_9BACT|nr:hypothetical protein DYBT9275_01582 [Dyadobacter sp. CECT 9275]
MNKFDVLFDNWITSDTCRSENKLYMIKFCAAFVLYKAGCGAVLCKGLEIMSNGNAPQNAAFTIDFANWLCH